MQTTAIICLSMWRVHTSLCDSVNQAFATFRGDEITYMLNKIKAIQTKYNKLELTTFKPNEIHFLCVFVEWSAPKFGR